MSTGGLQAAALWNNGAIDTTVTNQIRCDSGLGTCSNPNGAGASWTIFDNFTVPSGPGWAVTGFDISDFFVNTPTANYKNTSWSIWLGDPLGSGASAGKLVASGTGVGVLSNLSGNCATNNCLELITVNFGAPVYLSSGTYYLGSTNLLTNTSDQTDRTTAAGNGLPGWEQSNGSTSGVANSTWNKGGSDFSFPSGGITAADSAFDINGTLAPEPGTMVLLSLALAGFGWLHRRRRA